jgi:hypothetical protein
MRAQIKEKQNKLKNLLQLNPTIDNPMDEVTAAHWLHCVTNICLDANRAYDRRYESWYGLPVRTQYYCR